MNVEARSVEKLYKVMNQIDPMLLQPAGVAGAVCDLKKESRELTDQDAVQQALADYCRSFPHANGWLCRQSEVVQIHGGRLPTAAPIQYGELAGDPHHSLLLRPNGTGGLRWITLVEKPGDCYIAVSHRHLGRGRAPDGGDRVAPLCYRVYWGRDTASPNRGLVPVATRFTGFENKEVKS